MPDFGPLVSAAWLAGHLGDRDLRVIDLRWYLDGRSGRDAHRAGHVPGAVFVDLERDLTAPSGPGRHPIPGPAQFEETMRAAGVDDRSGASRGEHGTQSRDRHATDPDTDAAPGRDDRCAVGGDDGTGAGSARGGASEEVASLDAVRTLPAPFAPC